METLKLQLKSQKSKDRACGHDVLPLKEEKPRKQVCFKADEELGEELDLPSDLTHFVVGDTAPEWWNTPILTAWPSAPTKSSQCSPALLGGALPKVLAAASSRWSYSQSQAEPGRER